MREGWPLSSRPPSCEHGYHTPGLCPTCYPYRSEALREVEGQMTQSATERVRREVARQVHGAESVRHPNGAAVACPQCHSSDVYQPVARKPELCCRYCWTYFTPAVPEPKPADPADAKADGQFQQRSAIARRTGGWTLEQWLEYLERQPDATLPSGVGGMLARRISELQAQLTTTVTGRL